VNELSFSFGENKNDKRSVSLVCCVLRSASEMTYIVSGGALNSTHSLPCVLRACDMMTIQAPQLRSLLPTHAITELGETKLQPATQYDSFVCGRCMLTNEGKSGVTVS